jgi:hypothetical protein
MVNRAERRRAEKAARKSQRQTILDVPLTPHTHGEYRHRHECAHDTALDGRVYPGADDTLAHARAYMTGCIVCAACGASYPAEWNHHSEQGRSTVRDCKVRGMHCDRCCTGIMEAWHTAF